MTNALDLLRAEQRRWRNSAEYKLARRLWPKATPLRKRQLEAMAIRESLKRQGQPQAVIDDVLKLHESMVRAN